MAATRHDRYEIKLVQLPGWAIPLAAFAAVGIVPLAAALGVGIVILMSPILLGVAAAQALPHHRQNAPAIARRRASRS